MKHLKLIIFCLIYHCLYGSISFEQLHDNPVKISSQLNLFKKLFEKNIQSLINSKVLENPYIPLNIHQIWIGPQEVPKKFKVMMDSWKNMNPNWKYKLWTNEDLDSFSLKNKESFDLVENWGGKSDILRYEILYRHGGVYIDIDFECIKPLDIFNYKFDFFCCVVPKTDVIANGIIGSCPKHPILKDCIKRVSGINKIKRDDYDSVWHLVGPGVFTNSILNFLSKFNDSSSFIAFPSSFFFPFPADLRFDFKSGKISRKQIYSFVRANSYAIHYWANTWQN